MHFKPLVAYRSAASEPTPAVVRDLANRHDMRIVEVDSCDDIIELVNRSFPAAIVYGHPAPSTALDPCRTLKGEAFSAVIPVVFVDETDRERGLAAMAAGADELLTTDMSPEEQAIRLDVALHRAGRDVSVHPSTRLPGTAQIERDITERISNGHKFAVCYADLDYFKEFNDRYGYKRGDTVIGVVSRILRDVVRAHAPTGFIGHIGGDDFIFNLPLESMDRCCREILEIFDLLMPFQYSPEDRQAGYFRAKDRRGNLHRVPIMSLSIGVVTNRNRRFEHPARVSELATEMKAYAKTLPGSVYAVDRRRDTSAEPDPPETPKP
jgi:GGDEF domain-containing protein